MRKTIEYIVGNHSDKGMVRKTNQDSFGSVKTDWGDLFVVADGMGGHKGGETASKLTVDHLCSSYKAKLVSDPLTFLKESIITADEKLNKTAKGNTDLEGMGTTVVALIIKDGKAYFSHVGDSRIYLFRNNKAFQLTKDHSYVQQMVDEGVIKAKEAEKHPMKNRILQAVGNGNVSPDMNHRKLYKKDVFLLCSDGLSGEVTPREMNSHLKSTKPMDACKTLVNLANERGGPDNSTVIVIRIEKGLQVPKEKKTILDDSISKTKPNYTNILLSGIILGVLLTVVSITTYKKLFPPKPKIEISITPPITPFPTPAIENDTTQIDSSGVEEDTLKTDESTVQKEPDIRESIDESQKGKIDDINSGDLLESDNNKEENKKESSENNNKKAEKNSKNEK